MSAIEFDRNVIINHLKCQEWQQVCDYCKEKFKVSFNDVTKQPNPLLVTQSTIDTFSYLLQDLANNNYEFTTQLIEVLKDVFRSLRNCLLYNAIAQAFVTKDPTILNNSYKILNSVRGSLLSNKEECVKMILQFLINTVAKNSSSGLPVWNIFQEIIMQLLTESDYSYYASALLYNVLYLQRDLVKACDKVYKHVLEGVASNEHEYNEFLLELFIQDVGFLNLYDTFTPVHRILLLTAVNDFISPRNENFDLSLQVIEFLATQFKRKSDCILKTVTSYLDDIEPQEVVLLLEILASLSAKERFLKQLQADKGLTINCAFLLRNIHSLGKESQNNFTPIQKLSEVNSCDGVVQKETIFGFKADLIRFLGNVCWKNQEIQDQLRELECVPLLLDCCNIDAMNPFIMQWTIFAVRNLCENNPANQAVIAAMTRRGLVDSSTLQEMGLTLHEDESNKIVVGPLP